MILHKKCTQSWTKVYVMNKFYYIAVQKKLINSSDLIETCVCIEQLILYLFMK